MPNTGKKNYALLVQYSAATGLPTGVVKPNVPTDPDYAPPVDDPLNCPASPVVLTNFQINNNTIDPVISDIQFNVFSGSNTGTVVPGATTSFVEQGSDHGIQIVAPQVGEQWGALGDNVVVDVFIFQDEVLLQATAINKYANVDVPRGDPDASWQPGTEREGLSGNIVINATSNTAARGSYTSGCVLAIQTTADFGTASFDIIMGGWFQKTVTVNTSSHLEIMDFYFSDVTFNVEGQHSNSYNLKLEFISINTPDNFIDIIPPGVPYTKALPLNLPGREDYIIRISKQ